MDARTAGEIKTADFAQKRARCVPNIGDYRHAPMQVLPAAASGRGLRLGRVLVHMLESFSEYIFGEFAIHVIQMRASERTLGKNIRRLLMAFGPIRWLLVVNGFLAFNILKYHQKPLGLDVILIFRRLLKISRWVWVVLDVF